MCRSHIMAFDLIPKASLSNGALDHPPSIGEIAMNFANKLGLVGGKESFL
jgi:hypothetical protein